MVPSPSLVHLYAFFRLRIQDDSTFLPQVERALELWRIGAITREAIARASGKSFTSTDMYMVPGAEELIAFNEGNWGDIMRQFLNSTYNLKEKSWVEIIKKAGEFVNGGRGVSPREVAGHGRFQDLSDDECK
jgi:hypothetical protein